MTRGVKVLEPGATLAQATEKMRQLHIGPVPVCDGDRLVGVVTDRDLVVRGIAMGHAPHTSPGDLARETDEATTRRMLERVSGPSRPSH